MIFVIFTSMLDKHIFNKLLYFNSGWSERFLSHWGLYPLALQKNNVE